MKYALVDGAFGHTGSFLVRELVQNGWKVVATDLEKKERAEIMTKERLFHTKNEFLDCRQLENVTFIPSNLTEKDSLRKLFSEKFFENDRKNYDVIFHPASLYDYGASYELLHMVNYEGLKNLLDIVLEYSETTGTEIPRFIHWSTCGVYGEPNYPTDQHGFIYPVNETALYDPPNNYSQTKVEQEELIFKTAEQEPTFQYTILRPAPIYGPYQTYGMFHIFYTIYIMGHSILAKIFPKKRKLMMPMIHVKDLVRAAVFVSQNEEAIGECYNVINDSPLQEHFLEFVYNELGITFSVVPMPWFFFKLLSKFTYFLAKRKEKKANKLGIRPKFDLPMVGYLTHQYYFSNKKLKDLGFHFLYNDFRKGIYETITWYKTHRWLPKFTEQLPKFVNTEPKPSSVSESHYKTPMKGGEIF
ncbi:MAG: putative Nucleoside-diphosphate-sugar epimerase [Promethearchaeota archaeon]|nr:MAG: putative Nucleoside-diphosphate-sugar epimerase [Candidatus Lokiarchaeota archaeon]